MLGVEALESGYGDSQVLFGIDLTVGRGEVVALLGRNGMGKTTIVRSIFGLLKPMRGRVLFEGEDMTGRQPFEIARRGLGLVPEGRQIFPTLSVEENLVATAASRFGAPRWTLPGIYELFPRLAERSHHLGSQLSGGEQQMLAIARALMGRPRILLLDEPSLGLAPLITREVFERLGEINKEEGLAMLIVEQNASLALAIAHRGCVLETGSIVAAGPADQLMADEAVRKAYLGF